MSFGFIHAACNSCIHSIIQRQLVVNNVGSHIYTIGEESLEDIVVNKLLTNNLTISTVESCTGGLIGHRITQVHGSSSVYNGGVISTSID